MANLADSFLADLDELSDADDTEPQPQQQQEEVSRLHETERYAQIMLKIEEADRESEAQLVADCTALSADIDEEIAAVHNFIRDNHRPKFPELESLVPHPLDFARVVRKIGNETDPTLVDLAGLLPSSIIMAVSVAASTTSGKLPQSEWLDTTMEACDRVLALDSDKKKLLDFVASRMERNAPNLSAVVGTEVASKLTGAAGGLSALAKMPACNVQLLGAKRKNAAGFSAAFSHTHAGYIEQAEILEITPLKQKESVCRTLAAKSALAARVDSVGGDPSGETGRMMLGKIRRKIEKGQELPPAKRPKPLPVPDMRSKKKRGGRRLRMRNERYAVTDMRRQLNRMPFGVPEESSLGNGFGEGYGMLSKAAASGNVRVPAARRSKDKERSYGRRNFDVAGTLSSLTFTPVQGIELVNPQARGDGHGGGAQCVYFSDLRKFLKIKKTHKSATE